MDLDVNSIRSEIFSPVKNLYLPPIDFIHKYNAADALYLNRRKVRNWNDLSDREWSEILNNSVKYFRDDLGRLKTEDDPSKFVANENAAQRDLQSQLLESIPNEMKSIAEYVFQSEGKLLRQHYFSSLVGMLKHTIGISPRTLSSDHRMLIHSIQLIHTASLLHDDILDSSEVRRGKEAPYKRFDNKKAILLGDYLFSKSCLNVSLIENVNAIKCISIIAENLIRGEFSQINSLRNLIVCYKDSKNVQSLVSDYFSKYLLKSYYKTASLFSFGGIACSELFEKACGEKLRRELVACMYFLGLNFGLAFQLMDDILDFTNSISLVNSDKPCLNDIKHGILTAPVYFLLSINPEKTIQMLKDPSSDNWIKAEMIENIVKLLLETYSIQASIVCVAQYLERYIHYINLISSSERNAFTSLLVEITDKLLKVTDSI